MNYVSAGDETSVHSVLFGQQERPTFCVPDLHFTPMSTENSKNMIVRTRFAPSPSGHLHVGGARTALYCWAFARGKDGKFILRIEDTDQKRSSAAASEAFLEDLRWLGILWDEGPTYETCGGGEAGPYYQSKRLDVYHQYFDQLLAESKAYYAFDTADELAAKQKACRASKINYRYDRAALKLSADEVKAKIEAGEPHVIRLKVADDQPVVIHDDVLGETTVPAGEIDDFVICKADGFPTYHFAVVVDDQTMGVTHVLRAQEHHKNSAKHMLIQDALAFRRPTYAHLPIMCNPDGSKMSKRDKDKALRKSIRESSIDQSPIASLDEETFNDWLRNKDKQLAFDDALAMADALGVQLPEINVDDFRRSGYLPEVLCNFLALNGWSPGHDIEKFDREFLIEQFSPERVMKAPAKFDRTKLLSFNLDAIQAMDSVEFVCHMRDHARDYRPSYMERLTEEQFIEFAQASQPRAKTLDGPFADSTFFILEDDEIMYGESKAIRKALNNGEPNGFAHLEAIEPLLNELEDWTVEHIESTVKTYADTNADGKLGKVAQPIRIAVTGGTISPAIFETLRILGKDAVVQRIRRCLSQRPTATTASN